MKQDKVKTNSFVTKKQAIPSPSVVPINTHPLLKLQLQLGNQVVSELI